MELEGGTAGLLHISQISYDRIENLEQMFTIGQQCSVMVIEHDKLNGRVALSTKNLEVWCIVGNVGVWCMVYSLWYIVYSVWWCMVNVGVW